MKQQKQPWILFWLPWTETQKKLKEHGVFFYNTTFTCINHNIKQTRGSKEKNKTFVFSQGLCLLFLFVPVCFPWRNKKSLFCFVCYDKQWTTNSRPKEGVVCFWEKTAFRFRSFWLTDCTFPSMQHIFLQWLFLSKQFSLPFVLRDTCFLNGSTLYFPKIILHSVPSTALLILKGILHAVYNTFLRDLLTCSKEYCIIS